MLRRAQHDTKLKGAIALVGTPSRMQRQQQGLSTYLERAGGNIHVLQVYPPASTSISSEISLSLSLVEHPVPISCEGGHLQ